MTTSTERVAAWREQNPDRLKELRRGWNARYRARQKALKAAIAETCNEQETERT